MPAFERVLISIDGACRRNGKPDCVSSGGVFIQTFRKRSQTPACKVLECSEKWSTNQRGEMKALHNALKSLIDHAYKYGGESLGDVLIVTDSEYLFNTMTRRWYVNWMGKNWCTASGAPVRNSDLWRAIVADYECLVDNYNVEPVFYHIKGHLIPFGKVTAMNMLEADSTGQCLLNACLKQYDRLAPTKQAKFEDAQEVSERNNGYKFDDAALRTFVTANMVADLIATRAVDAADQQS